MLDERNKILDERNKQILRAVIQCYINSAGPVGSRAVTKKYPFGLSPATIRNIMADLEEMGFLSQPHTSAGRIPTDSGYRFYVNTIISEMKETDTELPADFLKNIESVRKDVNSFLDDTAKILSQLSHYIGLTMAPPTDLTTLHKIDLIKFKKDQLAIVIVTDEGMIKNMVITIDPSISQKDLNRIANYINNEFSGKTIDEIRKSLVKDLNEGKLLCDNLITKATTICKNIFMSSPGNIYISGLSEMLNLPDFCSIEKIRALLKTLEDKHLIIKLLDKITESEGTQVFIGSENPLDEMKNFSLIAATYKEGKRPIGVIGIIGPTRMDYQRAISVVKLTAEYITNLLS